MTMPARFEISRLEAAHLASLVEEFIEVIDERSPADPAIERLTPAVYPDDDAASAEFHRLTASDLLDRRAADARAVLRTLRHDGERLEIDGAAGEIDLDLDADTAHAWLRTLSALRLVLASRLGIDDEDDHLDDDPRFGVYDWIGYRLDALVRALEG